MLFASTALLALLVQAPAQAPAAPVQVRVPASRPDRDVPGLALTELGHPGPPAELFDVERVVDGDTVYVLRNGERLKLRLLSVDTEEKLSGNPNPSPSKPETVFGQETTLWAQELFAATAEPGRPPRVGLRFPGGVERKDAYGRLLCHVVLADGRDFNLLLVELGKSPYFNKYGNSLICHRAFVDAQRRARANRLGVWDPNTNAARTPGAPSARRPYARLLPWWEARARAVERFRTLSAADPDRYVDAEDAGALQAALDSGREVQVFGSIFELFDEPNGDRTLLLRAPGGERALRVVVPAAHRADLAPLELERTREDYRQNYLWVAGRVTPRPRGFELRLPDPDRIRVADPPVGPGAGAETGTTPAGAPRERD